jgi:DNA-binding helix-hairpin-helix protein with protein kinase domain
MRDRGHFVNGCELQIDARIGRGGEGEVFAIRNMPNLAFKAYHSSIVRHRERKIAAMVGTGAAAKVPMVAFPCQIVVNERGEFSGFLMPRISGHKEVHELQTPSSRRTHFPSVDYAFIVQVALNIARVFAQVHEAGFVIGDVNERGILVSDKATVALIDADSFQVIDGERFYFCEVGVPEYTPPELQGKSLKSLVRTKDHDVFGLAVMLFRLLCMDRHPFSGRFSGVGDMPIEKAISEFRFAYSSRATGMEPPPGSVRLEDFPTSLAGAFEHTFSPGRVGMRPSAAMWVSVLHEFATSLRVCSRIRMHKYSREARECPWCRMEQASGSQLFFDTSFPQLSSFNGRIDSSRGYVIDLASFLSVINKVSVPSEIIIPVPPLTAKQKPSQEARKLLAERKANPAPKLSGFLAVFTGLIVGAATTNLFFFVLGLGIGVWLFCRPTGSPDRIRFEYRKLCDEITSHAQELQRKAPIGGMVQKKQELLEGISEYENLCTAFAKIETEFEELRREKQLADFLSLHQIRTAQISKINYSDVINLASYGIATALDAKKRNVREVYGIGPVKASEIRFWILRLEKKFQFRSNRSQEESLSVQKLQGEIISRQRGLEDRMIKLVAELRTETDKYERWNSTRDSEYERLLLRLDQLESDLLFLGVVPPPRPIVEPFRVQEFSKSPSSGNIAAAARNPTAKIVNPVTPGYLGVSYSVKCPICSGPMVTRVAQKGRNRGSVFWGCAKFPGCNGTRPI